MWLNQCSILLARMLSLAIMLTLSKKTLAFVYKNTLHALCLPQLFWATAYNDLICKTMCLISFLFKILALSILGVMWSTCKLFANSIWFTAETHVQSCQNCVCCDCLVSCCLNSWSMRVSITECQLKQGICQAKGKSELYAKLHW